MNDKKQVKDLIEEIPNWEYTYIYEGSRTCGKSYIQHLLYEKDKEIERLNNELQDFKVQDISNQEQLYNLIEENERLNNIINELEKWAMYYQDEVIKDEGQYAQDMINQSYYEGKIDGIQGIIDKLKELKGDKE